MSNDDLPPASFFRFFDYMHIDGFMVGRRAQTKESGWYLFDLQGAVVLGPVKDLVEFMLAARKEWIKKLVAEGFDMQSLKFDMDEVRQIMEELSQ